MVGAELTYVRIPLWGSTTMPRGAGMPCTWMDEWCGGMLGLQRLLGTFGYGGACASGKTSQ